jgi:hypothetical protein
MFRSRSSSNASLVKAARELERQMMTMEVVSGDEEADDQSPSTAAAQQMELPDRLAFGPYGITPLRGLHFDADQDTAAS